jgi:transcriptional regulator with XRE-family HTH domain
MLGLSQADVALACGLSVPTVKRLESGKGPGVTDEARAKLVRALEDAGIIFQPENGEGPGVRLKKVLP